MAAVAGKEYQAILVVTGTNVERTPFWVSIVANDGRVTTPREVNRQEGLELVGQDIAVNFTPQTNEMFFNIETNVLGNDVYYEFIIVEK